MEMQTLATLLFSLAILHTFCASFFSKIASRYPEGSVGENLWHFLGEIEVVFGLWASIFIGIWSFRYGTDEAAKFLESLNYTEAVFVFVIMTMAATKPVLWAAEKAIQTLANLLPLPKSWQLYACTLIIGPILGSVITEPAAMTVTALLLRDRFFGDELSPRFRYATVGLLFVNISIGGTLTHFAAPPVLMVAGPWGWDLMHMLTHFGWKAALAVSIGTLACAYVFRGELDALYARSQKGKKGKQPKAEVLPIWVLVIHFSFLVLTVANHHYMAFFLGLFLLFLGWCAISGEYQTELKIKESLLVAYFLAGLVTLGKLQDWWLKPLLGQMSDLAIFWGATGLTAVTDNAALAYLGTLVPTLSEAAKYALVAGAVTGGGLTVIANAPNPAGYGILKERFGEGGISPIGLFLGALPFTLLAAICFKFL